MKKNNKRTIITVIVLSLVIIVTIGVSYAYFAVLNGITGNDKNLNIVTEELGSIKWTGTKVFTSDGLLPGEMGLQTFTIEKSNNSGMGIYEIDLKGILDASFGSDVEISLYKSTNPTTDNVTITDGTSAADDAGNDIVHYYKEDVLNINGSPNLVYGPKALQNKDQIILEQADFDNTTLQKTTYYLVYHYKNADGDQNAQQGKSFSGEISVRLILKKGSQEEDGINAAQYITTLSASDTINLATDDYGNTRYIGASPNNYVSVDGELWRIIGVMKNVDDGTGNKSDRVKLIRASSIGNYLWDTSESSINSGYGVNEWSQADLMKLLNPGYESESIGGSLYWNRGSGTCYAGLNNNTTSCDFTSTGIKEKLKNMIGNAVWNTGSQGTNDYTSASNGLTKHFYAYERSENTGKICTSGDDCNDTILRTTTWTGKLGLMYPSDYGYATSGGSTTDRATCLNAVFNDWYSYSDCKNNDWLLYNQDSKWTLSPVADSLGAAYVYAFKLISFQDITDIDLPVVQTYGISRNNAIDFNSVYPTVYLKSNVKIASGVGSESDPFILEL